MEVQSKKDKLLAVLQLLGLDSKVLRNIPWNGFKTATVESPSSSQRLAQQIHCMASDKIASLICPENLAFHNENATFTDNKSFDSIKSNMCKLMFFGNRTVSLVVQSVTAASLKWKNARQMLQDQHSKLGQEAATMVTVGKNKMGQEKFASLRKAFKILADGGDIPKHNYTFRIDSSKLIATVEYLQESLQLKPGRMRDVSVAGHRFTNVTV